MIVLGRRSIFDLLGGFIAYRSLSPIDLRLRNLTHPHARIGRNASIQRIPRKGSPDHAAAVVKILREAHRLAHGTEAAAPSRLLYVGDSAGSDVPAFGHLCRVAGWSGRALIVAETEQPAEIRKERIDGITVHFANRWQAVAGFADEGRTAGYGSDQRTILVVDIDKTLIGARGRNSAPLDRARFQAALDVAQSFSGGAIDTTQLEMNLRELDRPAWHPLTADNQDVVAYVALIASSGAFGLDELHDWRQTGRGGFPSFLDALNERRHLLSPGISNLHDAIRRRVAHGSATPFAAFRQFEYWATRNAASPLPCPASAEERLATEIVITGEVWAAVQDWQHRGCVAFGLSDKPDEACFPPACREIEGALPLHRIPMSIIGGGR